MPTPAQPNSTVDTLEPGLGHPSPDPSPAVDVTEVALPNQQPIFAMPAKKDQIFCPLSAPPGGPMQARLWLGWGGHNVIEQQLFSFQTLTQDSLFNHRVFKHLCKPGSPTIDFSNTYTSCESFLLSPIPCLPAAPPAPSRESRPPRPTGSRQPPAEPPRSPGWQTRRSTPPEPAASPPPGRRPASCPRRVT